MKPLVALKSTTETFQPDATRCSAVASPIPDAAAVTRKGWVQIRGEEQFIIPPPVMIATGAFKVISFTMGSIVLCYLCTI